MYCTGLGHRGNLTGPSAAEWSRGKPGPLPPIVSGRAVSSLQAPAPKNSSLSGDCSDTFAAALTWAGAGERWGRWRGRAGGPPWDHSEDLLLITAPVVGKWAPGARHGAEGLPVPLLQLWASSQPCPAHPGQLFPSFGQSDVAWAPPNCPSFIHLFVPSFRSPGNLPLHPHVGRPEGESRDFASCPHLRAFPNLNQGNAASHGPCLRG